MENTSIDYWNTTRHCLRPLINHSVVYQKWWRHLGDTIDSSIKLFADDCLLFLYNIISKWLYRGRGSQLFCMPPGLISKAVKTYFDQKAVKTRLKPVKTGLNRSKRGQNLKVKNMCQGLWKNRVRWIYICPSVYSLCIWNAENLIQCNKM